ncbi:pentatricopeptide repeat-containing protein At4g02750-like [Oryza brachyantha]|nr:pentatricopeptide repeat-containing protein At4g02750-like [Oryza brachyantha]
MASRPIARAVHELSPLYRLSTKAPEFPEAGKSGQGENKALDLFDGMPTKSQVSWNAALAGLVDAGRTERALSLFREMPLKNAASYVTVIGGLSRAGAAPVARRLFDELTLDQHNVFTWTAMVSCHVRNGEPGRAVELFAALYGELFERGTLPNAHTLSSLLKACVALRSLAMAMQLHALAVKLLEEGTKDTTFVWNGLIDVHAKLGALPDAEKVFDAMRCKDASSWTIMMDGYSRHNLIDKALHLFRSMENKDAFTWSVIISCLWQNGLGEEALRLFIDSLRSGDRNNGGEAKPNAATYTTVLHICSVLSLLALGRQVHARAIKNGLSRSHVFVGNSLMNMYSGSGTAAALEKVFDEMAVRDTVSWNTAIQGLGQNGHGRRALALAERALALRLHNGNTFTAILAACSHAGLVAEGMRYFDAMADEYGVERTLDHYTGAIDLLGRAGWLERAHGLLVGMPFAPTAAAWTTLLHCCLAHRDRALGGIAARELRALQPDGDGWNYERLLRGCGGEGGGGEAQDRKSSAHLPGCSWVV